MRKIPVTMSRFDAGIYVKRDPSSVPENAVSDALNMLFDDGAPIARRPGYRRWSGTDLAARTVRSLYPWELQGTRVVLASVRNGANNELWQYDEGGAPAGAAITGGTGFTATYEHEFAGALSNVYIVNGSDATQRYDGTACVAAGVDGSGAGGSGTLSPPSAPTTALAAGGTIPDGTYQHSITFVYGQRGESIAGTEGTARTTNSGAGNSQINLTGIPLGPSGCTARRIYRRSTSVSTNPRSFVGELPDNTTTVFNDNNANVDYARRARTTSAIPPVSRYVVWNPYSRRTLQFWQTGDRSRFWWSEQNTPDITLSTSFDYISKDDGQEITGAAIYRNTTFITKTHSCFALEGTASTNWDLRTVDRSVGCTHNRTMAVTPKGVIFGGAEGIWIFDGVGIHLLSDPIDLLWKNVAQSWTSGNLIEWTTLSDFTQGGSSGGSTGFPNSGGAVSSGFVSV